MNTKCLQYSTRCLFIPLDTQISFTRYLNYYWIFELLLWILISELLHLRVPWLLSVGWGATILFSFSKYLIHRHRILSLHLQICLENEVNYSLCELHTMKFIFLKLYQWCPTYSLSLKYFSPGFFWKQRGRGSWLTRVGEKFINTQFLNTLGQT